jgi:hypothetical protein
MFSFVLAPEHAALARVWLVGCGAMGGALLARWVESGLPAGQITVVDPDPRGLPQGFTGAVVPDAISAWGHAPEPTLVVLTGDTAETLLCAPDHSMRHPRRNEARPLPRMAQRQ